MKQVIRPEEIIQIQNAKQFQKVALKVFRFQYENNTTYNQFCNLIGKTPVKVNSVEDIPFLPIDFFKSKAVLSVSDSPQITFTSSGTTGSSTSKHFVPRLDYYEYSFRTAFAHFYGNIENYTVLALLPSYLEREGSSLIYMVDDFIKRSQNPESGFYLHNYEALSEKLSRLDREGQQVLLIGVSYALLDLIEMQTFKLNNTIIMETGGMKGRRKEMIREELHQILAKGFGVNQIHSEYGMTELLSQAYSMGNGIFECPPWMDVLIRDTEDPLSHIGYGKTGGINVIDLANINSCAFIATQDLGKKFKNGSFEILGRFDHSDIRGCNLMVM